MATTKSIIDSGQLEFYIAILVRNGIISHTDSYTDIAEAVEANFDEKVEYEDIEEYYKGIPNIDSEDMRLAYQNLGYM